VDRWVSTRSVRIRYNPNKAKQLPCPISPYITPKRKGKVAAQKVAQHLQKLAKQKANDMLDEGLERSTQYIEGLGLKKRRGRKKMSGSALMAAGY
jgi:hypothetical protein